MPSNPWVAVGWRKREDIEVDLAPVPRRRRASPSGPRARSGCIPAQNQVELERRHACSTTTISIIATGPELAFDEIEGLGPEGNTQSVCHVDHALQARDALRDSSRERAGPHRHGAVQGASCFGPAYEFAFILETALRRRKVRDRVPMTFVTPEPYIGHLGLDGVGDTKALLESAMREKHIKWITNAKVAKVEAGKMHVEENDEDGADEGQARTALRASR